MPTKKVNVEFVELTLCDGLRILLVQKDIIQAWETDTPGEVLLRVIEHEDQYIRVLYPWSKIKELLPAVDHRKQPSRSKRKVSRDTGEREGRPKPPPPSSSEPSPLKPRSISPR